MLNIDQDSKDAQIGLMDLPVEILQVHTVL